MKKQVTNSISEKQVTNSISEKPLEKNPKGKTQKASSTYNCEMFTKLG